MANGATTEFVFDASGERVSEWNAATHAQLNGNYYWQGKPLAYYTTAADTSSAVGIHFEHQNYLGTERMRTMPTGAGGPGASLLGTWESRIFFSR